MTITNQTNRTSATGSGLVGQEVAFEFPISATSDVTVYNRVTATGVQTTLTETTNYTISIDGDSGGTLTTVTAIAATAQIHIVRNIPYTQTLDLVAGGTFNAENVEDAVDKNTKLSIQEKDRSDRSIRFPATDPTSSIDDLPNSIDRAGKFLYFGTDGTPAAAAGVTADDVVVSTYMEEVVDKSSEANLKAKINLEIGTDVQAQDAQLDDIADLAITNGNFIVGDGTNWVAESGATARTSLGAAATTDLANYVNKDGSVAYTGTGAGFKDENDMASDSDTATASQQSIKKYVDDQFNFSALTTEDSESDNMLKAHAYLATTDGWVYAFVESTAAHNQLLGYIGSTDDPANEGTLLQAVHITDSGYYGAIEFSVAEGEYFEITTTSTNAVTINWRSRGTLSKPVDNN